MPQNKKLVSTHENNWGKIEEKINQLNHVQSYQMASLAQKNTADDFS